MTRDTFTARLFSAALVLAALGTLGAIIWLSIVGREVNDYLAGLAGLTIGALLPSPMEARVGQVTARIVQPAGEPVPVEEVSSDPRIVHTGTISIPEGITAADIEKHLGNPLKGQ